MIDLATAYREQISRVIQDKARPITAGKCASWEDYRARTAELAGLQRAVDDFNYLVKQLLTEDGDDGL